MMLGNSGQSTGISGFPSYTNLGSLKLSISSFKFISVLFFFFIIRGFCNALLSFIYCFYRKMSPCYMTLRQALCMQGLMPSTFELTGFFTLLLVGKRTHCCCSERGFSLLLEFVQKRFCCDFGGKQFSQMYSWVNVLKLLTDSSFLARLFAEFEWQPCRLDW